MVCAEYVHILCMTFKGNYQDKFEEENVSYVDDKIEKPLHPHHPKLRPHKSKGRKHSKRRVDIIYENE